MIKETLTNIRQSGRNNNKQRAQGKGATAMRQISQRMNIFPSNLEAAANIHAPATIFTNSSTNNFSFANGSDARYFSFTSLFSASSTDFARYSVDYTQFKVLSITVLVSRFTNTIVTNLLSAIPALFVAVDPNTTTPTTNPTNNNVIWGDSSKYVASNIVKEEAVVFTFPGVSTSTNIWYSVGANNVGAIHIGSNIFAATHPSTNIPFFDIVISARCLFRGQA